MKGNKVTELVIIVGVVALGFLYLNRSTVAASLTAAVKKVAPATKAKAPPHDTVNTQYVPTGAAYAHSFGGYQV